jgi:CPA1 family monovalent cation:H+ antiporter
LAFGAYLTAESIHVSGVLAVVAAGILNGNIGPKGMSASTKIVLFNFWEYLAFLANSLIFLLIGLEVEWRVLLGHLGPIVVAVIGVTLARVVVVYGLSQLANRLPGEAELPFTWQHVLTWGGLRGAVSLALALGLPAALGQDRVLILSMTFGVVLVMLLLQATTIERLLRWLGLIGRPPLRVSYEEKRGQMLTLRAARRELEAMHTEGQLSPRAWEVLESEVTTAEAEAAADLRDPITRNPRLEEIELARARRQLLLTQRATLYNLQHDDLIDSQVFEELATKLDQALDDIDDDDDEGH